jgi:hypothetical protein
MKHIAMVFAAALFGLLATPVRAEQDEPAHNGSVELSLCHPDGKPAVNTAVEVTTKDHMSMGDQKAPQQHCTTDDTGRVTLPWPAGVWQLNVKAPGVGYGRTGQIEVVEGETAQVPLPALALYGILEGRVEDWHRGMVVKARASFDEPLTPTVKDDGTFRVEVPEDRWFVQADEGEKSRVALVGGDVAVRAGQVTKVVLRTVAEEARRAEAAETTKLLARINARTGKEPVTWAAGTVQDEAGQPVPGATV